MTRSRYSKKESLNRIIRKLENKPLTSDTPDVIWGEILSEDEAFSDLAELLEGSLPGETATLPTSVFVSASSLTFASVQQANAPSSTALNTVIMSPASHHWAHEHGGIYIVTGTAELSLTANTWSKMTGTFQGYMEDSGAEVLCDYDDDRIILYDAGTYFVSWNLGLYSDGTARTYIDAEIFLSGSAAVSTRNRTEFIVTGSYVAFSGGAFVDIPTSGYYVDLRLRPSASITVRPDAGQLIIERAIG